MEIAYFGIFKEFFGKGIGGYLLTDAILTSFNQKINKVWVHTCTLDHPNALKNYLARGMKVFKTEKIFFNPGKLIIFYFGISNFSFVLIFIEIFFIKNSRLDLS